MRRGEILGLAWERVDFDRKQLTIPAGGAKTNKTRRVPLNSEAIAVLRDWMMRTGRRTGPVFPSRKGASLGHFRKSWASLVEQAEIENFRFHDLRHHAASRMVMGGVDLYSVARVLGHSSTIMTQRYAHLAPEHLQRAVEVLVHGS